MTMTDSSFRADPATLSRFNEAREDAIRFALDCSAVAFPEVHARFNAGGRKACSEPLGYHLEFFRPVLETGDVTPFVGYLAWLVQVLRSRGVPHASVERSLDDLSTFFPIGSATLHSRCWARSRPAAWRCKQKRRPRLMTAPVQTAGKKQKPMAALQVAASAGSAVALLAQAIDREGSLPRAAMHVVQPPMYDIGRC